MFPRPPALVEVRRTRNELTDRDLMTAGEWLL
jgi:hypothetical protein